MALLLAKLKMEFQSPTCKANAFLLQFQPFWAVSRWNFFKCFPGGWLPSSVSCTETGFSYFSIMLVISIKIRGRGEPDTCARVTISSANWTKIFRRVETKIIKVHKGFIRSSPANVINRHTHVPSIQVNRGFPGPPLYCHLPAQMQHSASSGGSVDIFDWQKQLKA